MTKFAYIDDDGTQEAYTKLYPMLERFGFKGCFAVITSRIGRKGYMTSKQLLELQSKGHEIVSHSLTHPHMTEISLEEAVFELIHSKEMLKKLGIDASSFVFPFNQSNTDVSIQALKIYDWAFVGEEGNCLPGGLKRMGVGGRRQKELRRWVNRTIKEDTSLFLYGHSGGWNKVAQRRVRKLFEFIADKELTIQTVKTILKG